MFYSDCRWYINKFLMGGGVPCVWKKMISKMDNLYGCDDVTTENKSWFSLDVTFFNGMMEIETKCWHCWTLVNMLTKIFWKTLIKRILHFDLDFWMMINFGFMVSFAIFDFGSILICEMILVLIHLNPSPWWIWILPPFRFFVRQKSGNRIKKF